MALPWSSKTCIIKFPADVWTIFSSLGLHFCRLLSRGVHIFTFCLFEKESASVRTLTCPDGRDVQCSSLICLQHRSLKCGSVCSVNPNQF